MDRSTQDLENFGFHAANAGDALAAVRRQLEIVNWGNAREFGILDRASQCFVLYDEAAPRLGPSVDEAALSAWPSIDYFRRQLRETDRRFVADSLAQVHRFLAGCSPDSYRLYRLSFDLCVGTERRHVHRLLTHIRYLAPDELFPEGLCLFQLHLISSDQDYTPPFRAFCQLPGLLPVLFKQGEGLYPRFSDKRCLLVEGLRQGRAFKQLADQTDCSPNTINNMVADCRHQLYLSNNTQLVHYLTCFGCI